MKKLLGILFLITLASACGEAFDSESELLEESTGKATQALTKGSGGINGDPDYCDDPLSPCEVGEGDCDADSQCLGALVCGANNGDAFGFGPGKDDFCWAAHCEDGVTNGDEIGIDCGGSCGSCASENPLSNGDPAFCDDPLFPCDVGEGDCDSDSQCLGSLVCGANNGEAFGFDPGKDDFCWAAHCEDGLVSGDESGIDCGGSCGTCPSQRPGSNGDRYYCADPLFPCDIGEGDCDADSQCVGSLVCGANNGEAFGFGPGKDDFCWAPHCEDGVISGNETGVDCGGDCGSCPNQNPGTNGDPDYCDDPLFPCDIGEGDCDADSQCLGSLVCGANNGEAFGFGPGKDDFCWAEHCEDGVNSGDELGIDCGGSCGACPPEQPGNNGDGDYCDDPFYPCDAGEGDCDGDSQCSGALICGPNNGERFGFQPGPNDFCWGAHCNNGVLDGDEVSVDCGGSCGTCTAFAIGSAEFNAVRAVATLDDNSVIVGGVFSAATNFGDGNLVTPIGDRDGFIARYSMYGALQWVLEFGSSAFDEINYLKNEGTETLVAGRFSGTATLGSSSLVSQGGIDIFIASVADDGTVNWAHSFGGSGNENVFGLDTDSAGNIVISGTFDGDIDLGNGVRTSAGFQDVFVAKFDSSGQSLWDYVAGGADNDYVGEVGLDSDDNIWTTGAFFNTVDFGGGPLTSAGSADAFVLKISSSGTHVSSERFGSIGIDVGRSIQSDGSTGMVFAGAFSDVVNFLGSSLASVGGKDIFLASLDSTLNVNWVTRLGGVGDDEGRHVSVRSDGVILFTGIYSGSNTEIGTGTFNSAGEYDSFTTQYDASGSFLGGTRIYASPRSDFVTDTSWSSGIDYTSVGYFRADGSFAGRPLEIAEGVKSDGFVIFTD